LRFKELFENLKFHSALVKLNLQLAACQKSRVTHEKAVEIYIQTSEVLKTLRSIENMTMEFSKRQLEDQQKKLERAEKNTERVHQEMDQFQKLAQKAYQATEKLGMAIQDRVNPTERHKCR